MGRAIFILLFFLSLQTNAFANEDILSSILRADWPASLIRQERWILARTEVQEVIYGNSVVGYFRTNAKPVISGRLLITRIIPPGYREPIEYFVRYRDQREWTKLGQRKYVSPFKRIGVQPEGAVVGQFTKPFILTSWAIPEVQAVMPVVFNRQGEMVWAFVPQHNNQPLSSPVIAKRAGGEYAVMGQGTTPVLMTVNGLDGKTLRELEVPGESFHHGFDFSDAKQEFYALSVACRKVGYWDEMAPLFTGLKGIWNFLSLPRRTYAYGKLIRANLITGRVETVWTTDRSFQPRQDPNLSLHGYSDRFLDVRTREAYLAVLGSPSYRKTEWGFDCDTDYSHENSVRHYPGQGFLISARNLNRIFLISEAGDLKWALGNEGYNTHALGFNESSIGLQHDAHLLPGNRVLFLDNQAYFRGFPERSERASKVKIVSLVEQEAKVSWQKRLPLPGNGFRGNVEITSQGFLFAHLSGESTDPARFFEIEMRSGRFQAVMNLNPNSQLRAVSARPMDAITDEVFLNSRPDGLFQLSDLRVTEDDPGMASRGEVY